jgi:hypothetical protein
MRKPLPYCTFFQLSVRNIMIDAESLDLEVFTIVVAAQEEADMTETVDFAVQLRRPKLILLDAQDISVRMELTCIVLINQQNLK